MFPQTGGFERCTSPGCTRKHHAGGLCQGHAAAGWRGQPLRPLGSEGRWVDPPRATSSSAARTRTTPTPSRRRAGSPSMSGWCPRCWGVPCARASRCITATASSTTTAPRTCSCGTPTSPRAPASRKRSAGPAGFLAQYGKEFPEMTSEGW